MSPENAKPAVGAGGHREFLATDWKPLERNTLKGFCSIILPSGLKVRECTLHIREDKRWISMPAKAWTKSDGTTSYLPLVEFTSNHARDRFQKLALAAIDHMLGGGA